MQNPEKVGSFGVRIKKNPKKVPFGYAKFAGFLGEKLGKTGEWGLGRY